MKFKQTLSATPITNMIQQIVLSPILQGSGATTDSVVLTRNQARVLRDEMGLDEGAQFPETMPLNYRDQQGQPHQFNVNLVVED